MSPEALNEALNAADAAASLHEAAAVLRERCAPLRVVAVDAFDMRHEPPAARGLARQLFLAASDGHCWSVTTDASRAAGLFVSDLV
jgi:hypothetical protein